MPIMACSWKPLSEPRIPLQVGLVYRDAQRQQAMIDLLRSVLDGAWKHLDASQIADMA